MKGARRGGGGGVESPIYLYTHILYKIMILIPYLTVSYWKLLGIIENLKCYM